MALSCLCQFIVVLDVAIVNVAVPSMVRDLGVGDSLAQWVINSYAVIFAGFLLLGGRLGDVFGVRRILTLGVGLFTLASLLGGLAAGAPMLIGARMVQGLGAAIVAPATLAILVGHLEAGPVRQRGIGIWSAVTGAGGSLGVLLGGVITASLGWRWVLLVNVPLGLVVLVAASAWLPARRGPTGSVDIAGGVVATIGLIALVLSVVSAGEDGWLAPTTIAFAATAVMMSGVFVVIERHVAETPLVPLSLVRARPVASANLTQVFLSLSGLGMFFLMSLYFQQVAATDRSPPVSLSSRRTSLSSPGPPSGREQPDASGTARC